jgi:hypothetical protein
VRSEQKSRNLIEILLRFLLVAASVHKTESIFIHKVAAKVKSNDTLDSPHTFLTAKMMKIGGKILLCVSFRGVRNNTVENTSQD